MIGFAPASDLAPPALRVSGLGARIQGATGLENQVALAGVPLLRRDVSDLAMTMLCVVPGHQTQHPLPGVFDIGKAPVRIARHVLRRAEPRLDVRVVVRDARAAVAGLDAQLSKLGLQGKGALCRAIVGVQDHHPVAHTLSPFSALNELRRLIATLGFMYLPADELAAVEINDGEEVEERPSHRARQVSRRL